MCTPALSCMSVPRTFVHGCSSPWMFAKPLVSLIPIPLSPSSFYFPHFRIPRKRLTLGTKTMVHRYPFYVWLSSQGRGRLRTDSRFKNLFLIMVLNK